MASNAASTLSPVDYNFVAQANLGAPFQIDSGRIAEKKATTADIRDYAHLMVVTHIPVVDGLNSILQRKRITAPPETLLQGAYDAMIASLKADTGVALDRDYVEGQVDYQKGNAALFDTRSSMAPTRSSGRLRSAPSPRLKTTLSGPRNWPWARRPAFPRSRSPYSAQLVADRYYGDLAASAPSCAVASLGAVMSSASFAENRIRRPRCCPLIRCLDHIGALDCADKTTRTAQRRK